MERPAPSTASIAIATAILGVLVGYMLGQASSLGLLGGTPSNSNSTRRAPQPIGKIHPTAASDPYAASEDSDQEDLATFADDGGECKLTLVVRTDLGMTKGKIAAQCGHATLACYKALQRSATSAPLLRRWERDGQAKVALQVRGEEELELLHAQAVSLGICAHVVHDAGRTQIASGSATVLGVGPAPKAVVDRVTGGLKLL